MNICTERAMFGRHEDLQDWCAFHGIDMPLTWTRTLKPMVLNDAWLGRVNSGEREGDCDRG